jgi:hypothetical protein
MSDKFECQTCKRTATVKKGVPIPKCCGKPMKQLPLDICLQPDHPENARPMEDEEPCDDFRAGI